MGERGGEIPLCFEVEESGRVWVSWESRGGAGSLFPAVYAYGIIIMASIGG